MIRVIKFATNVRRALLALGVVLAAGSSASAGLEFNIRPNSPAPQGSLEMLDNGAIVATNINVPIAFSTQPGAGPLMLDAYLDFSTGTPTGPAVDGVTNYSSASANFFVLLGVLSDPIHGATTAPAAMSVNLNYSVVAPSTGSNLYVLTAMLNSGYVSPSVAGAYGMAGEFGFSGTISLSFFFDSQMAGDQVAGGSICMAPPSLPGSAGTSTTGNGNVASPAEAVPAPPSVILSALGALCAAGGPLSGRFRLRFGLGKGRKVA